MQKNSKWLAHVTEDGRTQTVKKHSEGTADLCSNFASVFDAASLGRYIGMMHDIGKYSEAFQKRLYGGKKVDHSTAGAYEACLQNGAVASFCISGHHSGLLNGGGSGDLEKSTLQGRINKAKSGELEDYSAWKEEILPLLFKEPTFCMTNINKTDFFIRMMYSCLVDADYLDTECFMRGEETPRVQSSYPMKEMHESFMQYISQWYPPVGILNKTRCDILDESIAEGKLGHSGLYTLTVPTGGGKTIASLGFALENAIARKAKRIIYVIPYTSIIEQTAAIFKNILGQENVLEHHTNAEFSVKKTFECDIDWQIKATENWDMPIIVTTSVQFFESIYSNKPSKMRKLHNIADSVIIFDEAQMLPLSYLRPCVSAIANLVSEYKATAVLCTATQPALNPIFEEISPGIVIKEICSEKLSSSRVFKRVKVSNIGKLNIDSVAHMMNGHEQVLCIVNSRKKAQDIFDSLVNEGSYHLSTLMFPAHRQEILKDIRLRLKEGMPCRVISTSLIEAGVDVDFPFVMREESGADSVLQAAGRCNREGRCDTSESDVFVFQLDEAPDTFFSTQVAAYRHTSELYSDIQIKEAIEFYFTEWRDLKGINFQDAKSILKMISEEFFPFESVAGLFKMIENNIYEVFIPINEGADLLQMFYNGYNSSWLYRKMQKYTVGVYQNHLNELIAQGSISLLGDAEDCRYILNDFSIYSWEKGLLMNSGLETGKALFI